MKKMLVTAGGRLGPFNSVVRTEAGWLVNGEIEFQTAAVGEASVEDATVADLPTSQREVPQKVTRRQAIRALFNHGITKADIQAHIDALPSPDKEHATIDFEESQDFERAWPWVSSLGTVLGFNAAALDALFIEAATL